MEIKDIIKEFVKYRNNQLVKYQKLYDYYIGKQAILSKKNRNNSKEDAKVVNNYANYISTIATAYFLGKNISYTANENVEIKEFEKLNNHLSTENEQKINFEIALNCSIFGKAYELLYINEAREIKQACIDTRDIFVLKDTSIDKKIIYAVRYDIADIGNDKKKVTLEVYDRLKVTTFSYTTTNPASINTEELVNEGQRLHGFNQVPIIEYRNNKSETGDFENIISLIDAYNTATSTSLDDLTDFSDSYLVLENMGGTQAEDISNLKKNKVLLTAENGKVYWLTKQVNDTYSENIKNRINQDIHKFSFTPDMGDEKFSGNTSGVALEFKMLPLEQLVAQKEMYFKESLNKRLDLFITFLNLKIKSVDLQKIFTRNLPRNMKEISEVMRNLKGVLSDETIISLFPTVEDARSEKEKLKGDSEIYQPFKIGE